MKNEADLHAFHIQSCSELDFKQITRFLSSKQVCQYKIGAKRIPNTPPRSKKSRCCTFICFYCYQEGHIKSNCPKYKAEMKNDQFSEIKVTTVMTMDEDKSNVLIAVSTDGKSSWILDLGSVYY